MLLLCLAGHELQGSPAWHHAEDVLLARDLGMGCFDTQFYLDNNQDLQVGGRAGAAGRQGCRGCLVTGRCSTMLAAAA